MDYNNKSLMQLRKDIVQNFVQEVEDTANRFKRETHEKIAEIAKLQIDIMYNEATGYDTKGERKELTLLNEELESFVTKNNKELEALEAKRNILLELRDNKFK